MLGEVVQEPPKPRAAIAPPPVRPSLRVLGMLEEAALRPCNAGRGCARPSQASCGHSAASSLPKSLRSLGVLKEAAFWPRDAGRGHVRPKPRAAIARPPQSPPPSVSQRLGRAGGGGAMAMLDPGAGGGNAKHSVLVRLISQKISHCSQLRPVCA